jgi:NADH:ubiquinone oxidoreductase subunit 4 (subunit M)
MNGRELAAVIPLAVLTVLFGVYPSLLLSPMKESLQALTTYINLPLP